MTVFRRVCECIYAVCLFVLSVVVKCADVYTRKLNSPPQDHWLSHAVGYVKHSQDQGRLYKNLKLNYKTPFIFV